MEETGITARIFPKYEKESTIIIFIFLNHQPDMFEKEYTRRGKIDAI